MGITDCNPTNFFTKISIAFELSVTTLWALFPTTHFPVLVQTQALPLYHGVILGRSLEVLAQVPWEAGAYTGLNEQRLH